VQCSPNNIGRDYKNAMVSSQLIALARQLAEAVEHFVDDGSSDVKRRAEIVSVANQVAALVTEPEELPMQHSANVSLLTGPSTGVGQQALMFSTTVDGGIDCDSHLMKMHALDEIPVEGSISLKELSKKTRAQDSLLGSLLSVPR